MPEPDFIPKNWMWLVEIGVVFLVILLLSFALKKIVAQLKKKRGPQDKVWRRKIHKILYVPLQIAIWGFGLAHIVDVAGSHFGLEATAKYVRPLKGAFIVSCLGWIVLRWIKEVFHHLAKKSEKLGVASSTIYALSKLSSFVFSILVLLIIFQIFGFNILPLLTFGGIGVAGVAFAAQDMIANFFGGAMLHFTRIFSIGDEILIPSSNNFEGEVKEIGWYTTMVEDFDRRPVYFPNALFSKANVINASRRTHRRIRETITVRYDDMPNVEKIVETLREKIGAHPDIDETQSFSLTLNKYGEYGLEIYLYCLVHRMSYLKFLKTKQELFLIMKDVVSQYGAEFCYPTSVVNLKQ